MGIRDPGSVRVDENKESVWKAVLVLLKKKWPCALTEREDNVRLINGFMAQARWDILIESQDKKKLIAMAAVPKSQDRLNRIIKMTYKYFEGISDKLRVGDILLRRKIESTGYRLINYDIADILEQF